MNDVHTLLSWTGTILQAGGALWLAANIATSRFAFPFMLVGALIWTSIAYVAGDSALATQNAVFAAINVVGIWRWWK